jgi:hypothetical protein
MAAIYAGQPFRQVLRDLGLTSNQVWGLTKTDPEWSAALEAALTAARRDDLEHGTNAAYVAGVSATSAVVSEVQSSHFAPAPPTSGRMRGGLSGLATGK